MDEHISEHSSFEAFCISVHSPLHTRAYIPSPRAPDLLADFHSPFDLVVDPCKLHTRAYSPSLGSFDLSLASLSFDLVVDPYELSYWGISLLPSLLALLS